MQLDDTDREVLRALRENGRTTNAAIARRVRLAPSAVLERVRKLERRGVIRGYETRLDPRAFGLDLLTFIHIRTCEPIGSTEIGHRIAALAGVQEVHLLAGDYCYLIKARTRNTEALAALLKRVGSIRGVTGSVTTLALDTLKECIGVETAPGS